MLDLAGSPGDPTQQAGSGPGQRLSAVKSCLPENNAFKMVTAGHVGLTETGASQGC